METSDEDVSQSGTHLIASFKKSKPRTRHNLAKEPSVSLSPRDFISDGSSTVAENEESVVNQQKIGQVRRLVAVVPSPLRNREDFEYIEVNEPSVELVLRQFKRKGELQYEIKLTDGQIRVVDFEQLTTIDEGPEALQRFEDFHSSESEEDSETYTSKTEPDMKLRPNAKRSNKKGFVDFTAIQLSSDEDELVAQSSKSRQTRRGLLSKITDSSRSRPRRRLAKQSSSGESSDNFTTRRRNAKRPVRALEPVRRSGRKRSTPNNRFDEIGDEEEDEDSSSSRDILRSDVVHSRKRKRGRQQQAFDKPARDGVRHSERSTRHYGNMKEAGIGDIYRSDSEPTYAAPKVVAVREVFQPLPRNDAFRARHVEGCETCGQGSNIASLIYCQGCSLSYHKNCLGHRAGREHIVTKIGSENFVLQCRRCLNVARSKDATAPDLAKCQDCKRSGPSCKAFKKRKTTQQEQKDREDNGGDDPIAYVPPALINNPKNVLFRCMTCWRGFHYHHLPSLSPYSMDIARDEDEIADERFQEYCKQWQCKDCHELNSKKVSGIIAWRPSDIESFVPGTACERLSEDDKQYLLKWDKQSYFRASWHSGSWTWGVTAAAMRKAYFKREDGPRMRTEDAIPEEYLRIDIVLNVRFTSIVDIKSEEIDKARIKEVDEALIKYKGLGYEDAVWEKVPTSEDGDRWLDFVTAYNDWVAGRYVRYPKQTPLKARLEKVRGTAFAKLEKQKQPETLVGGELMKYQIEGLNWLYYQWYSQKNGILADEMGLGKTIQVIGFMATLVQDHHCFPFLVVVPNSTCANWRREIKQWVPSLRVVTFFGSSQARDMAYRYEMFPEGSKELRCHIVVTSYEAAADDSCRKVFRNVSWAGLIVDEGQRLKNDKSQLYTALNAVRAPFRLLLTGTPLQNNARELFNLLQFLDDSINAAELEEKYAEMTNENVKELHDKIRPYILRRTKVQVLTFLPPLAQIIVPISMSTLQKKLYKSILAKNPELLKALFSTNKALKQQERANLSNILMQLRKCLCHPFVYSREIEERSEIAAVSHRNLVEASAKLQLLELLLPKLKENGHRVLIFSQFLDMLSIIEDFLDGMEMTYQRLDGTIGSLEKQKRIDQFNAPGSPLFAFLLSTRAGGVGINLATADTVIILDADFNPHQDIQAVSRAHRIGQKKKVLCFQLMTRGSAEEKIVQMGRKKMALDHVVVEQLDTEDLEDKDVESILKHGAAELFKDDDVDHDIRYDEASVTKLLDRTHVENTKTGGDDSAESQFSFARVWANEQGALEDSLQPDKEEEEEAAPDPGVWDKILKERQAVAAAEALARAEALGRGKRNRMNVDYNLNEKEGGVDISPAKPEGHRRRQRVYNDSDTDFQAEQSEDEESAEEGEPEVLEELTEQNKVQDRVKHKGTLAGAAIPPGAQGAGQQNHISSTQKSTKIAPKVPAVKFSNISIPKSKVVADKKKAQYKSQLQIQPVEKANAIKSSPSAPIVIDLSSDSDSDTRDAYKSAVKPFKRAQIPERSPFDQQMAHAHYNFPICPACHTQHPRGACALKVAGPEHCGLCGLAHYGHSRTCPHINSETQVRDMLEALKNSPEPRHLVDAAAKYLRGVKGTLVQKKKKDREKATGMVHPPQSKTLVPLPSNMAGAPGVSGSMVQNGGRMSESITPTGPPSQQMGGRRPGGQNGSAMGVDETAVQSALLGYLGK